MKKLIFIFIFLCASPLFAATQYVRVGAVGSADGSDWTNAYTAIPADPTHGDTYYLADGVYGDATFGDENYAGTDYATILKATASAHGTETGWDSGYGDGVAQFTSVKIQGPYFVFDGVTGSGTSGYGIKVGPKLCEEVTGTGEIVVLSLAQPHSTYGNDHVYIKHIDIEGLGETCTQSLWDTEGWTVCSFPIKLSRDPSSEIYIQNNYLHEGSSNLHAAGWTSGEVSGNYFGHNYSISTDPSCHGQQFSVATSQGVSVFNNVFDDSTTFVLGAHNEGGGITGFKFYNNIILPGDFSAVFSMAESGESDGIISSFFHHNTFSGVSCGARGAIFVGTLTDVDNQKSYAYNNLFYNSTDPRMDNPDKTAGGVVYDYNAYLDCSGTYTPETNDIDETPGASPFLGSTYRLLSGTYAQDAGKTDLGSPYNGLDYYGVQRDATPDIGASEYTPPTGASQLGITETGISHGGS